MNSRVNLIRGRTICGIQLCKQTVDSIPRVCFRLLRVLLVFLCLQLDILNVASSNVTYIFCTGNVNNNVHIISSP